MNDITFKERMKADAILVSTELQKIYSNKKNTLLNRLIEAEEYSLLAGGKRIRPILTLAFARMFGATDKAALPFAAALEMVHTASLIHDDLPSIDNDDLRRGRPTNHVVFGESTALLAGDGLLLDSFGLIAGNENVSLKSRAYAIKEFSDSIGSYGLVGGEFIDILGETEKFDLETLKTMHSMKTGALIRAAAVLGALCAEVDINDERIKDAVIYADSIGLAFQIIDDILDVTGTAEELGKNPGADAKDCKTTYLSFFTLEDAYSEAKALTEKATRAVGKYENSDFLVYLAEYLLNRKS